MHTNPNQSLFDIRCDYTGSLISQHTSEEEAEDAFSKLPRDRAQELTIWTHVPNAPDDAYLNPPPL